MVVYADVLFIINFILDYIIAFSTSKVTYIPASKSRLFLSSLSGGIYSIFMFEKRLGILYSPIGKLVVLSILLFVAFEIKSIRTFFKLFINYFIIAFSICGAITFFNYLYGVMIVENGLFYIKNNTFLLIPAALICSFLTVFVLKILSRNNKKSENKIGIKIYMEKKSVSVNGIIDTGNLLLDPVTLYPVIVVDYHSVAPILPEGISEFLKDGDNLNTVISRKYMNKIRLIPYNTVGSSSVLKGFKPDLVILNDKEKKILKDVIIAVSHKSLSKNNEFSAILNL